jgi:hypothetical protein
VFPIDLDVGNVVLEDSWYIDLSRNRISTGLVFLFLPGESLHKFARVARIRSGSALQEVRWWNRIPYLWESAFGEDAAEEDVSYAMAHDRFLQRANE